MDSIKINFSKSNSTNISPVRNGIDLKFNNDYSGGPIKRNLM